MWFLFMKDSRFRIIVLWANSHILINKPSLTSLLEVCSRSFLLFVIFSFFNLNHFPLCLDILIFKIWNSTAVHCLYDLWYPGRNFFFFVDRFCNHKIYTFSVSMLWIVCFSFESFLPTDWSCYFCGQNVRCTVPVLYSQCTVHFSP